MFPARCFASAESFFDGCSVIFVSIPQQMDTRIYSVPVTNNMAKNNLVQVSFCTGGKILRSWTAGSKVNAPAICNFDKIAFPVAGLSSQLRGLGNGNSSMDGAGRGMLVLWLPVFLLVKRTA